jgi:DNA-binding MarR family transcriptional regulator
MKDQVTLSKLEDHIGYWLRCLSNFVHHSFAQRLEKYDISVEQWVVLRTLFDKEGTSLQEAAQLIGVDNSSLSRMIERLVKKGLVVRVMHSKDRRTIVLSLSSKAKELVPLLAQQADINDVEFFKVIASPQRDLLVDLIKEVLAKNGWDEKGRGKDKFN